MNVSKFLLVNQPGITKDEPNYTYLYPPLGILSIYASLVDRFEKRPEHGCAVEIQDLVENEVQDLLDLVEREDPELIGFGTMTPGYRATIDQCRLIKERWPEKKIVLGGVHPTLFPDKTLANDCVDYVVFGEGEIAAGDLVVALNAGDDLAGVGSIGYKTESGERKVNPRNPKLVDLDEIPMLPFEQIGIEKYVAYAAKKLGYRSLGMILTRGCPFGCTFCGVDYTFTKKWRAQNPQEAVAQLKIYKEKYDFEGYWFKDSTFTLNPKWVIEFCNEVIRQDLDVRWSCHSRVDTIDERRIELMREAGCETIWFGIESGSTRILELLHKKIDHETSKRVFKLCHEYGINPRGLMMLGVPTETIDDIKATYELSLELDPEYIHLSVYSPFPGNPLYERFHSEDFVFEFTEDELMFDQACVDTGPVKKDTINALFAELSEAFYENPGKKIDWDKYRNEEVPDWDRKGPSSANMWWRAGRHPVEEDSSELQLRVVQ